MLHVVLLIAGIWTLATVFVYLLVLPLLRSAKRGEEGAFSHPEPRGAERVVYFEPRRRARNEASSSRRLPVGPVAAGYVGLALQRLTVHVATVLGASEVCLTVRESLPPHRLLTVAEQGIGAEAILDPPPPRHRVAWRALADGRPAISYADLRPATDDGPGCRGFVVTATPVAWNGAVSGALSAATCMPEIGRPHWRHIVLLEELAGVAGRVLEHQHRGELAGADTSAEVHALLDALIRKDASTRKLGGKVLSLARLAGGQLELDSVSAYELELTATLRHVGRLRLPARMLALPDSVRESESGVLRMSPVWGFEMLAGIPGLEPIAPLVRAQHERWDGHGYPDRLAGEHIPLASRIVAVCEAFAAVATDQNRMRPNRLSRAFDEVAARAGSEFDPAVPPVLETALATQAHARSLGAGT